MPEEILLEFPEDHIAVVRLNRPKAYNALNLNCRTLIAEKFNQLKAREDIRAVIITGNEKSFAAGADLKEMSGLSAVDYYKSHVERLYNAFADYPRPVIAAVNGFALGGGMELAMISDIILAGKSAKFGQPEVKVGVMPGAGGSQRLVRAVGKYNAMRLCLTGMMIGADEAKGMGWSVRCLTMTRSWTGPWRWQGSWPLCRRSGWSILNMPSCMVLICRSKVRWGWSGKACRSCCPARIGPRPWRPFWKNAKAPITANDF